MAGHSGPGASGSQINMFCYPSLSLKLKNCSFGEPTYSTISLIPQSEYFEYCLQPKCLFKKIHISIFLPHLVALGQTHTCR